MAFKTIADIRKAMVTGSFWQTFHHGNTSQPTKKDMGVRRVSVVQSGKFAFETIKSDGTIADSWCDFPKKDSVIFHDTTPASFTITESGKPMLTYTMSTAPAATPAPKAAPVTPAPAPVNPAPAPVNPAPAPVNPAPAPVNPATATLNKGVTAMTTATKKELTATAAAIVRIFALADSDPFTVLSKNPKATIADITGAIVELSPEFTTKDFAETTAPEFRFTAEDVATLAKIGVTPPAPKVTRRTMEGGKKVKKATATASTPKKDSYTRNHAFVDALKKGGTKKAIVADADKLYRDKNPGTKEPTGKDPLFVSEAIFRYNMPTLLLLGIVAANADKEPVFTLTHDTVTAPAK
jgi:hypothetical protein